MRRRAILRLGVLGASVACLLAGALPALGNGSSTWTAIPVSEPNVNMDGSTGPNAAVQGISCVSAGNCVAVGAFNDAATQVQGFVVEQSGGAWGRATIAPLPGDANGDPGVELKTVACSSVGNCTAFGVYDNADGLQGLLLTESSGTWSATRAALPAEMSPATNPQVTATGIACTSAGNCVAVGTYTTGAGDRRGLIATQSSGSWSYAQAPLPADASTSPEPNLASVACPAAGGCVVVGDYFDSSGNRVALELTLAAGTWSAATLPLPGDADASHASQMSAVACPAVGDCSAVGRYMKGLGEWHALLLTSSSGTWTAATAAPPPGWSGSGLPDVSMSALTCTSAGDCVAAGRYADDSGFHLAAVWVQSAGSWADGVDALVPGNADAHPESAINALSCSSAGNCVAVGKYTDDVGREEGLIDTAASGVWSSTQPPAPADADPSSPDAVVNAVACVSSGDCSAGGFYYQSGSGYEQANLLTRTSGTWSSTEMTFPHAVHAHGGYLTGVACASEGNCVAVGRYQPGEGDHGLLVEETDGTWTTVDGVLPADADVGNGQPDTLTTVACPSAGNCVAVGTYTDTSGNTLPLLLVETNGTWAHGEGIALPDTAGNPTASIAGVSCLSAGNCVVVGNYQNSLNYQEPFTLTLAAGTWTARAVPLPGNANSAGNPIASLNGVSCAGTRCVAVGTYQDDSGANHGLVDVYTGGSWRDGEEAAVPTGGTQEALSAVSCPAAGHCRAAGGYQDSSGLWQASLLTETAADTWTAATGSVPADANADPGANVSALSCASDNCAAVGIYQDGARNQQMLVLAQDASGAWAQAPALALPAAADATRGATLDGVSCLDGGYCTAVGKFADSGGDWHGMAVLESAGTWGSLAATGAPDDADATYPEDQPSSVSCTPSGACVAAGRYETSVPGWLAWEPMLLTRSGLAPTVTGISPSSGSTAGGTTVTISGTNLDGVTAVKFGTVAAASFTAVSATQVTAVSPAAGAGSVHVTVTTALGTSATSGADTFTYQAPVTTTTTTAETTTTATTSTTTTATTTTTSTDTTTTSTTTTSTTTAPDGTVVATAPPGSTGTVTTTPPGSAVPAATISWSPATFGDRPVTVQADPSPTLPAGFIVLGPTNNVVVSIVVRDSDGNVVHDLGAPLEIVIPNPHVTDFVPQVSDDGVNWRQLAFLAARALAAGQQDGYFTDDAGDFHILTRHLSLFAVMSKINATTSASGKALAPANSHRWGDAAFVHPGCLQTRLTTPATIVRPHRVRFAFFVDEQAAAYLQVFLHGKALPIVAAKSTWRGNVIGGPTRTRVHVTVLHIGTIKVSFKVKGLVHGARLKLLLLDFDGERIARSFVVR